MEQISLFDLGLDVDNNVKENIITNFKEKEKNPMCNNFPKRRVLSLFSGCGGMDIGFEGGFTCMKRSINTVLHPDWVQEDIGYWVKVAKTGFETVFANDIRPDAKAAWVSYFKKKYKNANEIYHLERDIHEN